MTRLTDTLTAEQRLLQTTLRGFLTEHSSSDAVRAAIESPLGHDPSVHRRMAQELGLYGIAIPEQFGGSGSSFTELAVVLTELGRFLTPGPYFSTVVLASQALLLSGDRDACATWLPPIADGAITGTLAVLEEPEDWDLKQAATSALPRNDGWIVTGTKIVVSDGADADLLLVLASTEHGPTLFAIEGDAQGVARSALDPLDLTRRLGTVTLRNARATPVGDIGAGRAVVQNTLLRATVALACEQVGGAARCLDMATEYAKARVQFGRPIGSFQAIKHMLADVLVDNESARAAAFHAARSVDHAPDDLPWLAPLGKAFASDAYLTAAAANIQVHGGIGYTWEHDAHLYFRRATSAKQFLGSPDFHRERLAGHVLAGLAG